MDNALHITAATAMSSVLLPPEVDCLEMNNASSARPQYHVVRQLYDASSSADLYLCETRGGHTDQSTRTAATLVVMKVGSAASSRRRNSVHHISASSPLQLYTGADSILQELAVANRLFGEAVPHQNIVQFRSVAESQAPDCPTTNNNNSEKLVVLVMEYCPGGDLFSLLEMQPDRRFDEAHALSLFTQIVSGVHHLHSLGIAHLDISLENVLLDSHGLAKICDFGLSVFIDDDQRQSAVGAVGKLIYMAPEVASGGAYDPVVADVWSLGIVLFILLTGSPLFQVARPSDAAWSALRKVGIRGILSHWKLEEGLSSCTIALLTSMLRVDPSQRLQCLDEVLEAVPTDLRSV